MRDLRDAYKKVDDLPGGDEKSVKYEEFFAGPFKTILGQIEAALPGAGPYLAGGSSPTLADVAMTQFLFDYLDGGGWPGEKDAVAKAVAGLPRVESATKLVLAAIAPWLEARPKGFF